MLVYLASRCFGNEKRRDLAMISGSVGPELVFLGAVYMRGQ